MKVFRNYTQSQLELQYDSGARNPELNAKREARQKRVEAEAAEIRRTAKAHLDVVYGRHVREKIDVFPAASAKAPLMAFIHGGYWKQRSKAEFAWMAPAFNEAGIAFASIGYPLCPEVRIGDIVGSVRRALVHLSSNASSLGFDGNRIHVAGHSAGGHLTAMMAATDFAQHGGPPDLVKSATCVSGLYDLEPLAMVKVNQDLKIVPADLDPLSPVRLTPRPHVTINATVGDQEAEEFVRNTKELITAWRGRGAEVTEIAAPDFHHFDILDEFGRMGRPMFERVRQVMGA
jgi:arylformamidase